MVYVFEGPRNSGKSFLSKHISKKYYIPRFQFAFSDYVRQLGLQSQEGKEMHAFALGKELMLMQIFRDLKFPTDIIHDRGILSVLTWGILEGRISEDQMKSQLQIFADSELCKSTTIVFLTGDNPNQIARNKDEWDKFDGDARELECYEKVISNYESLGLGQVERFTNRFDERTLSEFEYMFEDLILR